jgi:hypothetical protein
MAKNNKEKSYWPHMILGFLVLGITLSYWTVKSASSIPVQESNEYMMKYQQADMNINEIIERKALFDKNYKIELLNVQTAVQEIKNAKRAKEEKSVVLTEGENSFSYRVIDNNSMFMPDANVTFVLTRPHTVKDDIVIEDISVVDGTFNVSNVSITKPGRYILQFRAKIGDAIGYSEISAYLSPE